MAQQHLDGPQIGAVLQQVRGATVPQGMRRDAFAEPARARLRAGIQTVLSEIG